MNVLQKCLQPSRETAERKLMRKLHARLMELSRGSRAEFYWRNGIIRCRWLTPTKGWRDQRQEAFPLSIGGWSLTGYASFADAEHLSKKRRA
ncbi:MAG: hypothetical protein ABL901_09150 [Hyphomicrobiaceae bacterium]